MHRTHNPNVKNLLFTFYRQQLVVLHLEEQARRLEYTKEWFEI